MKKICYLLLFLLQFSLLYSQPIRYQVSGYVVDNQNGESVLFARATMLHPLDSTMIYSAIGDENGYFIFNKVTAGDYILQIDASHYNTYYASINISTSTVLDTIHLEVNPVKLTEIVIKEKRPLYVVDGEKNIYNVQEDPRIQIGTASDALQYTPSVEVDIEGNVLLRGNANVEIWINDKPTNLHKEALKQYLKTLPANMIKKIEVITNPSARYSTSGNSIINIVTTSPMQKNQLLTFGSGVALYPYVIPWISYVFNNQKLSLNVYGGYSYSKQKNSEIKNSYIFDNKSSLYNKDSSFNKGIQKYHYPYLGFYLQINLDSASVLTFSSYGQYSYNPRNYEYQTTRTEYVLNPGIYHFTEIPGSTTKGFYTSNGFWYQRYISPQVQKIQVSGNIAVSDFNVPNNTIRIYPDFPSYNFNHSSLWKTKSFTSNTKAEYTLLRDSSRREWAIGVSNNFINQKDIRNYTFWDTTSLDFIPDTVRSRRFNLLTSLSDIYVTMSQQIKQWKIKVGVRLEHKYVNANYPKKDSYNFQKNYGNAVPSLHISYQSPNYKHAFNASYTFRGVLPTAEQLTTFVLYDIEYFSVGNPFLKPSYTHQVEIGWNCFIERFGSIGINSYYKGNKNNISKSSDVIFSDFFGRIVNYSQDVNIGNSRQLGGEINIAYQLKNFFICRFSAHLFDYAYQYQLRQNEVIKQELFAYNFKINFWGKWKMLEFTLSGNYSSPTLGLMSISKPFISVDCGISADFFKRHFSIYLNMRDIFNTIKYGQTSNNPYYLSDNLYQYNSRYLAVGIIFRFGKMDLEHQARKGGTLN